MKRISTIKYYDNFFILPTISIRSATRLFFDDINQKRHEERNSSLRFSWLKYGISIRIYTKKSEKNMPIFAKSIRA